MITYHVPRFAFFQRSLKLRGHCQIAFPVLGARQGTVDKRVHATNSATPMGKPQRALAETKAGTRNVVCP